MTTENMTTGTPTSRKEKVKIQVKNPSQERSRQTVLTILNACEDILINEGFFGVTTDKIAKNAGVSIGSLYQFFGNKESVVSAVVHELLKNDQELFLSRIKGIETLSYPEKVHRLVDVAVDIYSVKPLLRQKLQNMQVYLADQQVMSSVMGSYFNLIESILTPIEGRDTRTRALVAVTAFSGLMDRMIVECPNIRENKALVQEIHRLFEGYILTDK